MSAEGEKADRSVTPGPVARPGLMLCAALLGMLPALTAASAHETSGVAGGNAGAGADQGTRQGADQAADRRAAQTAGDLEWLEVHGRRGGAPKTAAGFAPSRPSLDQTQPTSTVSAAAIHRLLAPTADYDDVVNLTPSSMNINPAGPGLQQDFGQSIRGLQYTEFSVLFDGIPIPGFPFNLSPQPGAYFMSHDLGSVMVNRGPGPASAIGSATFGGFVSLASPELSRDPAGEAYGTFGSFGTKLFGAEAQSGDIKALGGADVLLDLSREESGGALSGIGTERRNLFFKYVQPIGQSTTVTVVSNLDNDETKTPYGTTLQNIEQFGRNFSLNSDPSSQTVNGYNTDHYTTDFEYIAVHSDLGAGWQLDNRAYTTAYYQRDGHGADPGGTSPNLSGLIDLNGTPTTVADDVPGFASQYDFRNWGDVLRMIKSTGLGMLDFGVWADREGFTTNTTTVDFTRGAVPYALPGDAPVTAQYFASLTTAQPYAELVMKPFDTLTFTAGLKYSSVTRYLDGPITLTGGPADDHASYNKPLPAFDFNWRPRKDLSFFAQAAEGFLTPELNLFSTTTIASVQPSTSWSYQVGTVYQRDWLTLGVDGYDIDFHNYIASNTVGGFQTFFNQGGATFRGVEVETTLRLGYGFAAYANGSLNDATYGNNGNNLAQTPRRVASLALLYDKASVVRAHDELFGSLVLKSVGPQYGLDTAFQGQADQFPIKSYSELDLNAGYLLPLFGTRLRTGVNVTNLLDHHALTGYAGQTLEGQALYWVQAGRGIFFSVAAFL